jgi:hypothetical protein
MALVLIASLLGAFGGGRLSRATASVPGVHLDYARLQRADAPAEYRFRAAPSLARGGVLTLRIARRLDDLMEIERIEPEPRESRTTAEGLEYDLQTRADGGPVEVMIRYRPLRFGRYRGEVQLGDAPPLPTDQFVYP